MKLIDKILYLILIFAVALGSFCVGGLFEQQHKEIITVTETIEVMREVPKIVIKEVPKFIIQTVKVRPVLRDFASGEEFISIMQEPRKSICYLGVDCVSFARAFVYVVQRKGYYVDTEITMGGWHMVVKGFVEGDTEIWYYDPRQQRAWMEFRKGKGISVGAKDYSTTTQGNQGKHKGKGKGKGHNK